MTKSCVVCKKYPVSGDNSRSFHKFPFNEDIKKQWMDATGISKLTVNCTVCSDHFTPQSYHKTDGFGTVKRLLRNAVPLVSREDICRDEEVIDESNVDQFENIMYEDNSQSSQSQIRTSNDNDTNILDDFGDQNYTNDSSANSANDKVYTDKMSDKLKRKMSTTDIRALNIKRMFRFQDGGETKYICREEFVTEEAWNKFLRLMLLNRRRMEGLRQRMYRRKKIFQSIEHYKEPLKQEEEYNPEKYLEIILKE